MLDYANAALTTKIVQLNLLGAPRFTVRLNGEQVTDFTNNDPNRGQPTAPSHVGLQIHPGSRVAFRNLEYRPL